ncbi:hypothetical protein JTB14_006743 [Gonioctena quinquepunctata]|nr:hypothetical protein JTB14_006743 [Gonioctena quinquepunctata]
MHLTLGLLPADARGTIEFLEKFDKLFDILNSSCLGSSNKYKNAFDNSDYQKEYLNGMIEFINKINIFNKKGENVTGRSRSKKCWIITINGIKKLWEKLSESSIKYLQTRRVNQDCLENFFGSMRQQGGNCINPTPIQFQRGFKKLFCQSYLHSNDMNCKDDLDDLLMNLKSQHVTKVNNFSENKISKAITLPDYDYQKEDLTFENPFNYVCGYLIKKALKIHNCDICNQYSKTIEDLDFGHLLTYFKSYDTGKVYLEGLRVPSEAFVHYIYNLEKIFPLRSKIFAKFSNFNSLCKPFKMFLLFIHVPQFLIHM